MKRCGVLIAVIALATPLYAGSSAEETAVTQLVRRFEQARHDFDLPAITSMAAGNYVEISPLGEIDPREKMLGYYAPNKKVPAPPYTLDDVDVRLLGDTAAVIARLAYQVPNHSAALRVVYVVQHEPSGWQMVSVQYTPIHEGH